MMLSSAARSVPRMKKKDHRPENMCKNWKMAYEKLFMAESDLVCGSFDTLGRAIILAKRFD